jgi:hypothetical protein
MSTYNPKQMTQNSAPAVQRAMTANIAAAVLAGPAGHVCTPTCTHEVANKELSAPVRVKGTLHATARATRA